MITKDLESEKGKGTGTAYTHIGTKNVYKIEDLSKDTALS